MAGKSGRAERRTDALSRERIVQVAIELLDSEGESGLTFRALATRLATGAGAIYWHVADKSKLLAATTDYVVEAAINIALERAAPADAIRALALGLFDAIDEHPWVGAQLSREPWQTAMLHIFERVGVQLQALGVPESAQFTAACTLVNYVLGVAGQNAANARNHQHEAFVADREGFLAHAAAQWSELDPGQYPFLRRMAQPLRDHDDRQEFRAGLDLILAGIATMD